MFQRTRTPPQREQAEPARSAGLGSSCAWEPAATSRQLHRVEGCLAVVWIEPVGLGSLTLFKIRAEWCVWVGMSSGCLPHSSGLYLGGEGRAERRASALPYSGQLVTGALWCAILCLVLQRTLSSWASVQVLSESRVSARRVVAEGLPLSCLPNEGIREWPLEPGSWEWPVPGLLAFLIVAERSAG